MFIREVDFNVILLTLAVHVYRLTQECWAADMNRRPSFIDILKRLEKIKDNLPSDHHWNLFAS